jgi:hypothetical protein
MSVTLKLELEQPVRVTWTTRREHQRETHAQTHAQSERVPWARSRPTMRTGSRANVESSTQRPIHHRILLYLFARADCLCMSLSASLFPAFHSRYPDASSLLQPPSGTWLQQSQTTKTKTKKISTHKTQHSSPKPHPNNNPLEPALSQNSHPLSRHGFRNPALSLSLSLSPTPASIHSRVTQPQGQPSAGCFSLVLFSHSRTALLVHSVSGADKTLMQLASHHGVRVGH